MYTWKIKWVNLYESPWGIINKFMFANQIHGIDAAKELTTTQLRKIENYRVNYIHTGIVSNYQFNDNSWCIGDKSIIDYGTENIQYLLRPLLSLQNKHIRSNQICSTVIKKTLKYCPECMKYGYHYIFHQFTFLDRCLIHNKKLINTCLICNNEIPYAIEFQKNIHSYQCKYCNSYLFSNDNFEIVLNEWNRVVVVKKNFLPFKNPNIVPFIITNNFKQCLQDKDINKVLKSLFTNKSILIQPKYSIKRCLQWNEIDFGNVVAPNLNSHKDIAQYSYIYAFKKFYQHLSKSQRLGTKIKVVELFINRCEYYPLIIQSQSQLFEIDILKHCGLNAIIFYLWKRDMEYVFFKREKIYRSRYNCRTNHVYKFVADNDVITYLYKISKILPEYIEEDYKFSILNHIAITLIKKKYTEWKKLIKYLVINHNNNDFKMKLNNIKLRNSPDEYNMEFLLIIEKEKHEYKLFFDNN